MLIKFIAIIIFSIIKKRDVGEMIKLSLLFDQPRLQDFGQSRFWLAWKFPSNLL